MPACQQRTKNKSRNDLKQICVFISKDRNKVVITLHYLFKCDDNCGLYMSEVICFCLLFLYEGLFLRVNMILMIILNSLNVCQKSLCVVEMSSVSSSENQVYFLSREIGGVLLIFFAHSLVPYN